MLISHKHQFVFIKTSKTAGTSIELSLSNLIGSDAIVTPLFNVTGYHKPRNFLDIAGNQIFYEHESSDTIRQILGE